MGTLALWVVLIGLISTPTLLAASLAALNARPDGDTRDY